MGWAETRGARNATEVMRDGTEMRTELMHSGARLGRCKVFLAGLVATTTALAAGSASAGIHTWDVVEVFSNADGSIQYVELLDRGLTGNEVNVGTGTLTSSLGSFVFTGGAVTAPTDGKRYLVATAAFAALPGAPTPDEIIPPGNTPFFDTTGDTITFSSGDALIFPAVPTNGTDSWDEDVIGNVGPNSPENYAGTQVNVDASPPPAAGPPTAPTASRGLVLALVAMLALLGTALQRGLATRRS